MATRPYRHRTGNQALVREINLSAIMNRLHKHAPISRSALAEMTGLNKTTVSSLVQELISHQFVREVGLDSAGAGRPAMLLEFNPRAGCIISAEIEVGFISVICANFSTEIIWRAKEFTEPDADHEQIIHHLLLLLHQAVDTAHTTQIPVLGIAVGVPGLVDRDSGMLLFGPNLYWENVPLGEILHHEFDLPIFVDNNANMAALGEFYFGVAQDYNDILYLSIGVGLGGGIIQGGQLVTGATGFAGEFGHMTVIPDGELCSCGNRGCWETLVSYKALLNRVQSALSNGQPSLLAQTGNSWPHNLTITDIQNAATSGDRLVLEILADIGCFLGIGVASLVNILNPELVVLGGIDSVMSEFLLPFLQKELKQRALRWNVEPTQVVLAQHGADACVMGGMAMIYQAILTKPSIVTA